MQPGDKVIYYHQLKPSMATILRRRGGNRLDIAADLYGHVQFVPIGRGPNEAAPADWGSHHAIPAHDGRPAYLPPEPFPLPVEVRKPKWPQIAGLVFAASAVTEALHALIAHFVR